MEFYVKFNSAAILKQIIDSINPLVKECIFKFNSNGLFMQAMDASLISVICLNINKEKFDEYVCDDEYELGLSIVDLSKIIKCVDNKDSLSFQYTKGSDKLNIEFEGSGKSKKKTKFEMNFKRY